MSKTLQLIIVAALFAGWAWTNPADLLPEGGVINSDGGVTTTQQQDGALSEWGFFQIPEPGIEDGTAFLASVTISDPSAILGNLDPDRIAILLREEEIIFDVNNEEFREIVEQALDHWESQLPVSLEAPVYAFDANSLTIDFAIPLSAASSTALITAAIAEAAALGSAVADLNQFAYIAAVAHQVALPTVDDPRLTGSLSVGFTGARGYHLAIFQAEAGPVSILDAAGNLIAKLTATAANFGLPAGDYLIRVGPEADNNDLISRSLGDGVSDQAGDDSALVVDCASAKIETVTVTTDDYDTLLELFRSDAGNLLAGQPGLLSLYLNSQTITDFDTTNTTVDNPVVTVVTRQITGLLIAAEPEHADAIVQQLETLSDLWYVATIDTHQDTNIVPGLVVVGGGIEFAASDQAVAYQRLETPLTNTTPAGDSPTSLLDDSTVTVELTYGWSTSGTHRDVQFVRVGESTPSIVYLPTTTGTVTAAITSELGDTWSCTVTPEGDGSDDGGGGTGNGDDDSGTDDSDDDTDPPVVAAVDLRVYCDEAQTDAVTVTTVPDDPALQALIRRDATMAIGAFESVHGIHVRAWSPSATNAADSAAVAYDLVVGTTIIGGDSAVVEAALVEGLSNQWYVASVVPVDLGIPTFAPTVTVGITMSPIDVAMPYCRLEVPVGLQQNADSAGGARDATSPANLTIAPGTRVKIGFTTTTTDAAGTTETSEAFDVVTFYGDSPRYAVAMLPQSSAPVTVQVTVDPDNAIAETDEDNNTCNLLCRDDAPPPEVKFSTRAFLTPGTPTLPMLFELRSGHLRGENPPVDWHDFIIVHDGDLTIDTDAGLHLFGQLLAEQGIINVDVGADLTIGEIAELVAPAGVTLTAEGGILVLGLDPTIPVTVDTPGDVVVITDPNININTNTSGITITDANTISLTTNVTDFGNLGTNDDSQSGGGITISANVDITAARSSDPQVELPEIHLDLRRDILHVFAVVKNNSDAPLTFEFPSSLQVDFTVNDAYRYSDHHSFTAALTNITVMPGARHLWQLHVPAAGIREALATADRAIANSDRWLVKTELVGTIPMQAQTVVHDFAFDDRFYFDVEQPNKDADDVDEADNEDESEDGDHEERDWIVGELPLSVDILGKFKGLHLLTEIVQHPRGGELEWRDGELTYLPNADFEGDDWLKLRLPDGSEVERRLRVGLQTFDLEIDAGWNLVSFPVVPTEGLDTLLGPIPGATLWGWSTTGRGKYFRPDAVVPGQGYWLFSKKAMTLSFLGTPATDMAAPEARRGLQLIGGVNPKNFAEEGQRLGTFAGGKYRQADKIRPGRGYWLFVE